MTCPDRKRQIRPNRCLTCEHCGGFNNGGVLCFKANRKINYDLPGLSRDLALPQRRA